MRNQLLCMLIGVSVAATAQAATYRWDGACGPAMNDWLSVCGEDTNWDTPGSVLPGVADDVVIPSGSGHVRFSSSSTVVRSVVMEQATSLEIAQSLTVAQPSAFLGTTFRNSAGLNAADLVVFLGTNNTSRGVLRGAGPFRNLGTLIGHGQWEAVVINNGWVEISQTLNLLNEFANREVLSLRNGAIIKGDLLVNEKGIMQLSETGTARIETEFFADFAGRIGASAGELLFAGRDKEFHDTRFVSGPGGRIRLSSSGIQNTNWLEGTVQASGSGANFDLLGDFALDGTLDVNFTGGGNALIGRLDTADNAHLLNRGNMSWNGNTRIEGAGRVTSTGVTLYFGTGGYIGVPTTMELGFLFRDENSSLMVAAPILVRGLMEYLGGGGTLDRGAFGTGAITLAGGQLNKLFDATVNPNTDLAIFVPLNAQGEVNVETGSLTLRGGGDIASGRFEADTGAKITFYEGDYTASGPVLLRGAGTIEVGVNAFTVPITVSNATGEIRLIVDNENPDQLDAGGVVLFQGTLHSGDLMNLGLFRWKGGLLSGVLVQNVAGARMVIDFGRPKFLSQDLHNYLGLLEQRTGFQMNARSEFNNFGQWKITGSSHISLDPALAGSTQKPGVFNNGTLTHVSSGNSRISPPFRNSDRVEVLQGHLTFDDIPRIDPSGVFKNGGTWFIPEGAGVTFPRQITGISGDTKFFGANTALLKKLARIARGDTDNEFGTVHPEVRLQKDQSVNLDQPLTIGEGGRLSGEENSSITAPEFNNVAGDILGDLELDGPAKANLARILAGASAGCLRFGAGLDTTNSTFEIELGGTATNDFDRIKVTGALELHGDTIRFLLLDDYLPLAGDRYEFFTADAITGADSLDYSFVNAPAGMTWHVATNSTSVELVIDRVPVITETRSPANVPLNWFNQYGLPMDDNLDSDGDGRINSDEWRWGSDPTVADSRLLIARRNDGDIELGWPSAAGRTYALFQAADAGGPLEVTLTEIPAAPPFNFMRLAVDGPEPSALFRLQLESTPAAP